MKTVAKYLIIFSIVVGSLLRLHKFSQLNTFAGDEGKQVIFAEDIIQGNFFPTYGEASSLDEQQQFQVHNSPIGIYFQTVLYLLSGRNLHGYLFSYVVLNLLTIYFVYSALQKLQFQKAALVSVVLLSLSPQMIGNSVWTSQPVNALFFETLALYLFSIFYQKKEDKWLLFSFFASLLATHMYPPMYLLLIVKLFIYFYLLKNHIRDKKLFFFQSILITLLTYSPYLLQELKYSFANTHAVKDFLTVNQSVTNSSATGAEKIATLFKKITSFISYEFATFPFAIGSYVVLKCVSFFKNKPSNKLKKVFYSTFALVFVPVSILSLLLLSPSVAGGRAYVDIIFLFIVLLFALLHENTKFEFVVSFLLLFLFINLIPLSQYFFEPNKDLVPLSTIQQTTQYITQNSEKYSISKPYVHVVSSGDKWGWDSTIYWYLLEKHYNEDLVKIDFYTNKPKTNTQHNTNKIFLVCHNVEVNSCTTAWNSIAVHINRSFSNYSVTEIKTISQNSVLVLE